MEIDIGGSISTHNYEYVLNAIAQVGNRISRLKVVKGLVPKIVSDLFLLKEQNIYKVSNFLRDT